MKIKFNMDTFACSEHLKLYVVREKAKKLLPNKIQEINFNPNIGKRKNKYIFILMQLLAPNRIRSVT